MTIGKHYLIQFATSFILASLSFPIAAMADCIDKQQAAEIARKILRQNDDKPLRSTKFNNSQTEDSTLAPYYIFHTDSSFAIISGDDAIGPVLGYSLTNTIGDELPCGLKALLNNIGKNIEIAKSPSPVGEGVEVKYAKSDTQDYVVGSDEVVLTTAPWDQGYPYNAQCPDECVTGCVITAYAIMMQYYQYPSYPFGCTRSYTSYSGVNVPARNLYEHYYNWSVMPCRELTRDDSPETIDNVSTLMADIGAALRANYGSPNGTGSEYQEEVMVRHFDFFQGPSYLLDDFEGGFYAWTDSLRSRIDKGHPVLYCANGWPAGHAFIFDGYKDNNMFHVNWGWGGYCNGFFTLDCLMPYMGYNLSGDQCAIFDFEPMSNFTDWRVYDEERERVFPDLATALMAAPIGEHCNLQLLEDHHTPSVFFQIWYDEEAEEDNFVENFRNITVNLDGHHVWNFDGPGIGIRGGGNYTYTLNIIDKTGQGSITTKHAVFELDNNCTLNIENANCLSTESSVFYLSGNSKLNINGGHYKGKSCCIDNWGKDNKDAQINVANARIESEGYPVEIFGNINIENSTVVATTDNARPNFIYGNANITATSLENEAGGNVIYCPNNEANVTLTDVLTTSKWPIYIFMSGSKVNCISGLYGGEVGSNMLASGSRCIENTDPVTKERYPWAVISDDLTGIESTETSETIETQSTPIYTPWGYKAFCPQRGINIINGKKFIAK